MKGDFSRWQFDPQNNFSAVLQQQGRVLLDTDVTSQGLIDNDWRITAAQDWVGDVAAVPLTEPNAFAVTQAQVSGGAVTLTIGEGHIWANGLLVRLGDESGGPSALGTVATKATYLEPPLVANQGDIGSIAAGVQDAVILEAWQQSVSAFQDTDLLEPALGGPDTSERMVTTAAFRLARLLQGQTCRDVYFDENGLGKLSVTLQPPITVPGDCPVLAGGGYSGFEHRLCRIEISEPSGTDSMFKWSRMNGGLVGRGSFNPATQQIAITANLPAITSAGLPTVYLEIEALDPNLGYWVVTCGATATLNNGALQLPATPSFGTYPASLGPVFFRLWDGVAKVSDFATGSAVALEDGIELQFDPDGAGKYRAGDYWVFPVRARDLTNPQTLIDQSRPQGVKYYRVVIAEVTWGAGGSASSADGSIQDCRGLVQPLTAKCGCCTCRVGDGITSFGEFTSIQKAIDSLPKLGGEVCILPGRYFENVRIVNRRDVVIHGCGWQTRIASASLGTAAPPRIAAVSTTDSAAATTAEAVITIINSRAIELRSFAVEAATDEIGILLQGTRNQLGNQNNSNDVQLRSLITMGHVENVLMHELIVIAANRPAIQVLACIDVNLRRSLTAMTNTGGTWPAIYLSGRELHVEDNWVGVVSSTIDLPESVIQDLKSQACAGSAYKLMLMSSLGMASTGSSFLAPGGIQIAGRSSDIYIDRNEIEGGRGNGITLGSLILLDQNNKRTGSLLGLSATGAFNECAPGDNSTPGTVTEGGGTVKVASGGMLSNIYIRRNRIRNTGLCGIGPVAFFDLITTLEVITIHGLWIIENEIEDTVQRTVAPISLQNGRLQGYGAICVPDVSGLTVRDNLILNSGADLSDPVSGIFVLHGEMIEISRNQVLETRDWSGFEGTVSDARVAILMGFVTPYTTESSKLITLEEIYTNKNAVNSQTAFGGTLYAPGSPALRVHDNTVRAAGGLALAALGLGTFSILNNHFATAVVPGRSPTVGIEAIVILNLGTALDTGRRTILPTSGYTDYQQASDIGLAPVAGVATATAAGTVLFSNNMVVLDARALNRLALVSNLIFSADDVGFHNNICQILAVSRRTLMDLLLLGSTVRVTGNRFQESPLSVYASGMTVGKANITSLNEATFCIFILGTYLLPGNTNLILSQANNEDGCSSVYKTLFG